MPLEKASECDHVGMLKFSTERMNEEIIRLLFFVLYWFNRI